METICFLVDVDRIMEHVCDLLMTITDSKSIIYISTPYIDWDYTIIHHGKQITVYELINNICEVSHVNILVKEGGILYNKSDILPRLPTSCNVKTVKNFGPILKDHFLPWTSTVEEIFNNNKSDEKIDHAFETINRGIYSFNQSYILINNAIAVVGDFHFYDKGTPVQGAEKKYGIAAVLHANDSFVNYAHSNWDAQNTQSTVGFVVSSNEHELICKWILESKHYCYIESPLLISHPETSNKIIECLVQRLIRAHFSKENDPFKCMILVNSKKKSSISTVFESSEIIADKLNYTLEYIKSELEKHIGSSIMLKNRLFIGYVDNVEFFSTIFIQDGRQCLLSSSAICDMMSKNSELGVIIDDQDRINNFQQTIWHKHADILEKTDDNIAFDDFFTSCVEDYFTKIKRHYLWRDNVLSEIDYTKSKMFKFEDAVTKKLLGEAYFS